MNFEKRSMAIVSFLPMACSEGRGFCGATRRLLHSRRLGNVARAGVKNDRPHLSNPLMGMDTPWLSNTSHLCNDRHMRWMVRHARLVHACTYFLPCRFVFFLVGRGT